MLEEESDLFEDCLQILNPLLSVLEDIQVHWVGLVVVEEGDHGQQKGPDIALEWVEF